MTFLEFARENVRWLSAGVLITGATGFGQTFYISIFAPHFREEFSLSHGDWGLIYMIATLASAAAITQTGRLSDHFRARTLAPAVILLFALVCVGVSLTTSVVFFAFLIFGLRWCGQGMLSHIGVVAMGKWFRAGRARALAMANLGFSAAEAALPALALSLIAVVGWRTTWQLSAIALLIVAPIIWVLLLRERSPKATAEEQGGPGILENRHWTRTEMMRTWLFWAMFPGLIALSWIGTVVFFQIAPLTEEKGWDMFAYAATAYPVFSALAVLSSFFIGSWADRVGALHLLPYYLLGWAIACVLIGAADSLQFGIFAMAVAGVGTASAMIVVGAIFAELYGARHLGGIKAIYAAGSVLASALGPGASGLMLDAGVSVSAQLFGMGLVLLALCVWFWFIRAHIRRVAVN
ncbi:MAG: MFS transporter [Pseudomonadota bacterium]